MRINYKRELEEAARTMILIHEPYTLIRMIVRMIVRKVRIKHAGILLYDKSKNTYVLTVSRGEAGLKIPAGYARLDPHSPLIRLFSRRQNNIFSVDGGVLIYDKINELLWKAKVLSRDNLLRDLILESQGQMEILGAVACIPSYFQHTLIGLLLLGEKLSGEKFYPQELDFFTALASDVAMAVRNAQLFQDLQAESKKVRDLFINTTITLAAAIEAKDKYTRGHTQRVTALSLALARELIKMEKLNPRDLENLHIAALLHDIGKIAVPEKILNKIEPLTEDDMKIIREHPLRGVEILKPIKELEVSLLGVKYHHERYDGSGYPEGLKRQEIPLIASIISVADAFDAMTTDRPYRPGRSISEAIEELKKCSGSQFDPLLVEAMVRLYEEGNTAELLKSGRC